MVKKLLITGFDPFGGETVNPSWEAVQLLPETVSGWQLHKLEVPTVFGKAAEVVLAAAEEIAPDAILCVGQAGGRSAVTPEVVPPVEMSRLPVVSFSSSILLVMTCT